MAPTWTDFSGQTYELKEDTGERWYRAGGEGDDKWKKGVPGHRNRPICNHMNKWTPQPERKWKIKLAGWLNRLGWASKGRVQPDMKQMLTWENGERWHRGSEDLPYHEAMDQFKGRLLQVVLKAAGGSKEKALQLCRSEPSYYDLIDRYSRLVILQALAKAGWKLSKAPQQLKLRETYLKLTRQLGISVGRD